MADKIFNLVTLIGASALIVYIIFYQPVVA